MLRIILDTNVLIEGAKDPNSYPVRIMRLALAGQLQPIFSPRTQREYQHVVDDLVADQEYKDLVRKFFEQGELVETHTRLPGVTADRDDDKFVELAQDGDVDYLITSDNHLLTLEKFGETDITLPDRFWNTYQAVAGEKVRALGYA